MSVSTIFASLGEQHASPHHCIFHLDGPFHELLADVWVLGTRDYAGVFATASVDNVRLWNTATGEELLRIQVPNLECHCCVFSVDGKAIITGVFFLQRIRWFKQPICSPCTHFFVASVRGVQVYMGWRFPSPSPTVNGMHALWEVWVPCMDLIHCGLCVPLSP